MIPQDKRAQIIAALKANPNVAAVAREVGGVSRSSVGNIARQAGIDVGTGGPKKATPAQKALILEALRVNPNASAVARAIGSLSYKAIARMAKKANIPLAGSLVRRPAKLTRKRKRATTLQDRPTEWAETGSQAGFTELA